MFGMSIPNENAIVQDIIFKSLDEYSSWISFLILVVNPALYALHYKLKGGELNVSEIKWLSFLVLQNIIVFDSLSKLFINL